MPLSDWQFQLGTLVMGPGTAYEIVQVDGIGMAPIEANDIALTGDGVYAARDRQTARQVILTIDVTDTPGAAFAATFAALVDAWATTNTDADLTWKVPGITNNRKVTGRPRRVAYAIDVPFDRGLARVACEFFCPSPYIKDAVTSTVVRY